MQNSEITLQNIMFIGIPQILVQYVINYTGGPEISPHIALNINCINERFWFDIISIICPQKLKFEELTITLK